MRILLADDQASLRKALRLLLEHETNTEVIGEVVDAHALPAATAALHPDVLLLDGDLPGIKTHTARRHLITTLRALQPDIYIIVLSCDPATDDPRFATSSDAYVSKTEPPDRLLAALHQAALCRSRSPRLALEHPKTPKGGEYKAVWVSDPQWQSTVSSQDI